jgi:hypothetical protein
MLALALAGTGLGTAFATVGIGKAPAPDAERAVVRTIIRQRVAQGEPAQPPAATGPAVQAPGKAEPAMTRDTILAAVDSYESEMKATLKEVEGLKKRAYDSKDIIRYNFLSTKLDEMKILEATVQPVIDSIRLPGVELFVMQAKLSTIRQGVEQMRKAAADAASATGDGMDTGISALDPSAAGRTDNSGEADLPPLGTPSATEGTSVRPAHASPYR